MNAPDWTGLATQIATLGAVLFAGLQVVGARAAKHRDFENLYVQRFWNLMDGFEFDPWTAGSVDDLSPKDRSRLTAYFQLCEDEIDLRRNGFISTKTWEIWVDGINSQCHRPAFRDALKSIPADELPSLRDLLEKSADPLDIIWIQKWWTGIGFMSRKQAAGQPRAAVQERQAARL